MTSPSYTPETAAREPMVDALLQEEAATARRYSIGLVPLGLILAVVVLGSLCIGAYPVSWERVASILVSPFHPHATPAQIAAVRVIRLPRVLLALLAGAGLGVSGSVLQGIMRNPLIGPDTIGISSGAACGGLLAILLNWPDWGLPVAAFVGGLAALVAVFALAHLSRGGILATVLAGVIVGAFFTAILGLIQYTADPENKLPAMIYWLIGSFAGATPEKAMILAPPVLVAGTVLVALRWRMNLLSLDEMDAAALGVRVGLLRWTIMAAVSLIVATQVSVSGIVGWVGLIVPHLSRMLVGPDHRRLVPASGLVGAIFLLLMDDFARTIVPQELPIGVLTAGIGTPLFVVLFWRAQSRGWSYE